MADTSLKIMPTMPQMTPFRTHDRVVRIPSRSFSVVNQNVEQDPIGLPAKPEPTRPGPGPFLLHPHETVGWISIWLAHCSDK